MSLQDPNRNAMWGRIIAEELYRSGVRHACISPGSRSTPLTLAFAQHPGIQTHIHIDERSAGFFALGCALSSHTPAVLVCTSGSAGAHYLPAVIEANHSRVPMIVLTADRPPELMNSGAGQTIDQIHLFHNQVRHFVQADTPHTEELSIKHLRASVCDLYARAMGFLGGEPGPVHMNQPFREPLAPIPVPDDIPQELTQTLAYQGQPGQKPWLSYVMPEHRQAPQSQIQELARLIDAAERPVIVCGPMPPSSQNLEAITRLAHAVRAPLLLDPVSQLRGGERIAHKISHYDAILRDTSWAKAHGPDLVLRFGAQPTSKVYRFWRGHHPEATEILINPWGRLLEPEQLPHTIVIADEGTFAHELRNHVTHHEAESTWSSLWMDADAQVERTVQATFEGDIWEGQIANIVARHLLQDDFLMLASSMPIRDMDTCGGLWTSHAGVISNRGANGIDGLISTAFGASTSNNRVVCIIGDVATLHDVGGLFAASQNRDLDVTFVVIQNGGGAIFSYLPIAQFPEHFEQFFITPHQIDFASVAKAYQIQYTDVKDAATLSKTLDIAREKGGAHLIEVEVDRTYNVEVHKDLFAQVRALLSGGDA